MNCEKQLLAEIFYDPKTFIEINTIIISDVFSEPMNKKIYEAMNELTDEGFGIDQLTVYRKMKENGFDVEGEKLIEYLDSMMLGNVTSAYAVSHAKMLLEDWKVKKISEVTKKIMNEGRKPDEVISELSEEIYKIKNLGTYEKDINLREHISDLINKIEEKYSGKIEAGLTSDSFPTLNKATGGIMPGDYVIIYGLDKSGKSSFGHRLLLDFAFKKKRIGIFSLEMDFEQVGYKQLSMVTGLGYLKMRNPRGNNLMPHEMQDFISKVRKIDNTNIFIDDRTYNFDQVLNKTRLWKREHNIDIFFYDYIGLFDSSDQAESVKYLIKSFSRRLKQTAKELNTPIIVVSQANDRDKTADSIDLLRDCDFALRICKPTELGIKEMDIRDNKKFQFKPNHFLVTVERSRYGVNKQNFVVAFINENFVEESLEPQYEAADEYII